MSGLEDVLILKDVQAWRAWLAENEYDSDGVWLLLAKKGSNGPTSLTYAQALDEALCSGWIDGQSKSVDKDTYKQRFTPRRARSLWSARNVTHIARLYTEGRMRERGIAEVERAKSDGRWERAYEGAASIKMPSDLQLALDHSPTASSMFAKLSSTNRYAVLHRVVTASNPTTRDRRISRLVEMLERGETPHPQ